MAQCRTFLTLGAVNGFLAVLLGAFAAHGLEDRIDADLLDVFATGVEYHALHALALLIAGLAARDTEQPRLTAAAGWAFGIGIVVFCGSLYVLALTGIRWLGAITPVGGTAFLVGWGVLAWRFARTPPASAKR